MQHTGHSASVGEVIGFEFNDELKGLRISSLLMTKTCLKNVVVFVKADTVVRSAGSRTSTPDHQLPYELWQELRRLNGLGLNLE